MKSYLESSSVPRFQRRRTSLATSIIGSPLFPLSDSADPRRAEFSNPRVSPGNNSCTNVTLPSESKRSPAQQRRSGHCTAAPDFSVKVAPVAADLPEGDGNGNDGISQVPSIDLDNFSSLRPFHYEGCSWAWTCLAVGSIQEACRASEAEDDLVAYAASLALSGETEQALLILEAYIVGLCVVCYETLSQEVEATRQEDLCRHHKRVVSEWLQMRRGPNVHLKDAEYRHVLRYVVALTDWRAVHRWYSIALVLHKDSDDGELYAAPKNAWFRYFFALFPTGVPLTAANTLSRGGNIPVLLEDLKAGETLGLLLTQCNEADLQFISAVTAFHTQRYRSCLVFASRALHLGAADERTFLELGSTRWLDAVSIRYVRCRAACELGERMQAVADIIFLLQCQVTPGCRKSSRVTKKRSKALLSGKHENMYVSCVGAALALYGTPLPEAREAVLAVLHNTSYSAFARRYVLSLAGYIHALTLLQVGEPDAAAEVGIQIAPYASNSLIGDCLYNVIVRASVGLEDSTLALETPLSPHRLLYLALSPAFFGGLSRNGIRLRRQTDTFKLLYPSCFFSYMPVRQILPFHMNRAFYFFSHGAHRDAWDDVCCAVAAADEIVGSTEFAFTECFPLRVYFFGCQAGFMLLETLFHEEIEVVKACLRVSEEPAVTPSSSVDGDKNPNAVPSPTSTSDQIPLKDGNTITDALLRGKERVFNENDALASEVMTFCRQWTRQIQRYYPHSVLGDVAQVRVAVMAGEKDMLKQAVVLSRRYPANTQAQNTLTLALYFTHNISEAVDIAQKNLQDFPHSRDVMEIHRWLQRKNMVYTFNYRTLVPLRYKPGSGERIFTKRMIIAVVLLAFNCSIVLLTFLLNFPDTIPIAERVKNVAVRLQLPSLIPLFFSAVFLVHAIVAAATPKNLIHTFLVDNHFCDTGLSRFLFSLRGIALVNVVNALQISLAGNNFLFDNAFYTAVLYLVLTCLFVPFTTRVWFLPSVDEPNVGVLSWLTLLSVDTVIAFVILLPHIVLAVLEPFTCLVYYLFLPSVRPTEQNVSGSIRRRLLYHEQHRYAMPSRFSVSSGSRFIHVRFLSLLYWRSHSARETVHVDEAQLEAEGFRVFPLIDPESVGVRIETLLFDSAARTSGAETFKADTADAHSFTREDDESDRASVQQRHQCPSNQQVKMPLYESLLEFCSEDVLEQLQHPGSVVEGVSVGRGNSKDSADESCSDDAGSAQQQGCTKAGDSASSRMENRSQDAEGSSSDDNKVALSPGESSYGSPAYALSRTPSCCSVRESEQFQRTTTNNDRLVELVMKTFDPAGEGVTDTSRRPKKVGASFAVHLPRAEAEHHERQHQQHSHPGEPDHAGKPGRGGDKRRRRSLLPDPYDRNDIPAEKGCSRSPVGAQLHTLRSPLANSGAISPVASVACATAKGRRDANRAEKDLPPQDAKANPIFTLDGATEIESFQGDGSESLTNSSKNNTQGGRGGPAERSPRTSLFARQNARGDDHNSSSDSGASDCSDETFAPPIVPHQYAPDPRRGGYHTRHPLPLEASDLNRRRSSVAPAHPEHQHAKMQGRTARPAGDAHSSAGAGGIAPTPDMMLLSAFMGARAVERGGPSHGAPPSPRTRSYFSTNPQSPQRRQQKGDVHRPFHVDELYADLSSPRYRKKTTTTLPPATLHPQSVPPRASTDSYDVFYLSRATSPREAGSLCSSLEGDPVYDYQMNMHPYENGSGYNFDGAAFCSLPTSTQTNPSMRQQSPAPPPPPLPPQRTALTSSSWAQFSLSSYTPPSLTEQIQPHANQSRTARRHVNGPGNRQETDYFSDDCPSVPREPGSEQALPPSTQQQQGTSQEDSNYSFDDIIDF